MFSNSYFNNELNNISIVILLFYCQVLYIFLQKVDIRNLKDFGRIAKIEMKKR